MKQSYYKIGEFSRLTGVSIKSLRYYDRIGVLKPSFVDSRTGYRYYAPEQMILLDILKLSMSFNLPLKDLNIKDGKTIPDLKGLIRTGQKKAMERLSETKKMLRLSTDISEQIDRLEKDRREKEIYSYKFTSRKILVEKWESGIDNHKNYLNKIALLRKRAKENDLTVLTQQGIFMDLIENKTYVFLSFDGDYQGDNAFSFSENTYKLMVLKEGDIKNIPWIIKEKNISAKCVFCLNTDIYDFCLFDHLHLFEAQFYPEN